MRVNAVKQPCCANFKEFDPALNVLQGLLRLRKKLKLLNPFILQRSKNSDVNTRVRVNFKLQRPWLDFNVAPYLGQLKTALIREEINLLVNENSADFCKGEQVLV